MKYTYSLHCSSFLGLPFRILNIELVKPKKGTTMETIGKKRIGGLQRNMFIASGEYMSTWQLGTQKDKHRTHSRPTGRNARAARFLMKT